jgi:hypothetical protein
MSTATAVRPQTGIRAEGLIGFDEARSETEAAPVEETRRDEEETAWRAIHASLLADSKDSDVQIRFEQLAEELEEAAAGLSATRRARNLPAFNEILALGEEVVPDVIARLKTSDNRPLWLRVLGTLTPFPPGAGMDTVDEAADAWIRWGRISS